jgi:hypothetical protein
MISSSSGGTGRKRLCFGYEEAMVASVAPRTSRVCRQLVLHNLELQLVAAGLVVLSLQLGGFRVGLTLLLFAQSFLWRGHLLARFRTTWPNLLTLRVARCGGDTHLLHHEPHLGDERAQFAGGRLLFSDQLPLLVALGCQVEVGSKFRVRVDPLSTSAPHFFRDQSSGRQIRFTSIPSSSIARLMAFIAMVCASLGVAGNGKAYAFEAL